VAVPYRDTALRDALAAARAIADDARRAGVLIRLAPRSLPWPGVEGEQMLGFADAAERIAADRDQALRAFAHGIGKGR
jgi:hypothetical protein